MERQSEGAGGAGSYSSVPEGRLHADVAALGGGLRRRPSPGRGGNDN